MSAVRPQAPSPFSLAPVPRTGPALASALRRSLGSLVACLGFRSYRPEQHYMRGGTTRGSRSLAARRQFAEQS
jgi:hypothetical protein